MRAVPGDVFDPGVVAAAARGCDVIISSAAMRDPAQLAISAADLAVAVADEAERAGHVRAWLTVGY
jgi:putative NADH-flavin reductase